MRIRLKGSPTLTDEHTFEIRDVGADKAAFTATPISGPTPLNVQFADESTRTPVAWSCTFGDGGTSTAQNLCHTYNAEKTYTVSLTVTNASNKLDIEIKTSL